MQDEGKMVRSLLSSIEGHFDGCTADSARGWLSIPGRRTPLGVAIYVNGSLHAEAKANKFRPDLLAAGKYPDGVCAYELPFDSTALLKASGGERLEIVVRAILHRRILLGRQVYPGGKIDSVSLKKPLLLNYFLKPAFIGGGYDGSNHSDEHLGAHRSSQYTELDHLASQAFRGVLQRDADSSGLRYISNKLGAGVTLEEIIAELIATPEFALKYRRNLTPHVAHLFLGVQQSLEAMLVERGMVLNLSPHDPIDNVDPKIVLSQIESVVQTVVAIAEIDRL